MTTQALNVAYENHARQAMLAEQILGKTESSNDVFEFAVAKEADTIDVNNMKLEDLMHIAFSEIEENSFYSFEFDESAKENAFDENLEQRVAA